MHLNSREAKTSKVIRQISGILLPYLERNSIGQYRRQEEYNLGACSVLVQDPH